MKIRLTEYLTALISVFALDLVYMDEFMSIGWGIPFKATFIFGIYSLFFLLCYYIREIFK